MSEATGYGGFAHRTPREPGSSPRRGGGANADQGELELRGHLGSGRGRTAGAPCLIHGGDDRDFLYTGGTSGMPKGVLVDRGRSRYGRGDERACDPHHLLRPLRLFGPRRERGQRSVVHLPTRDLVADVDHRRQGDLRRRRRWRDAVLQARHRPSRRPGRSAGVVPRPVRTKRHPVRRVTAASGVRPQMSPGVRVNSC